jgi:aspartokinase-like uncharacterized kinase
LSAFNQHPSPDSCSLIKLGGSLLDLPGLAGRLNKNLHRLSEFPILLVGGGGAADVVRQWDAVHRLTTSDSHELATMTLSLTAEFVSRLIPDAEIVADFRQAASVLAEQHIPIVDVPSALADAAVSLPQGWHVTSDSMAAVLARAWGLRELILIKSVECPRNATCEQAAEKGLVDGWFPQAVDKKLVVRWCHGRRAICDADVWLGVDRETRADMLDPVSRKKFSR